MNVRRACSEIRWHDHFGRHEPGQWSKTIQGEKAAAAASVTSAAALHSVKKEIENLSYLTCTWRTGIVNT